MKSDIPVKPVTAQWTDDQWKAIHAKNQDILVAAAAGSGKTAVLVERIIQKIVSKEMNVDELLIATFTNAAAAEMRERIGEALQKEIAKHPENMYVKKQLSLLNQASISTLHSFCLDVIRKFYYRIDFDPNFRIADETELLLLSDEVIAELFEDRYGQEDEAFFRLVDTFSNDRTDKELELIVYKLYEQSRSLPNPNQWLEQIIELYDVDADEKIDELPFIQPLKVYIDLQLNGAEELLNQALQLTKVAGGPYTRAEDYLGDLTIVQQMKNGLEIGWQALFEIMNSGWKFKRASRASGDEFDADLVKTADGYRKKAKDMLEKIREELFAKQPEQYIHDLQQMKPVYETLVDVVKEYAERLTIKKAEKGVIDFSDCEHLCLQILQDENGPTDVALDYRLKFKEVMVDEYQDTNMVQETIVKLVSKETEAEGNMFMVGDVKQSIYRFRLAEPNLFLNKYTRFSNPESGLRIDLSKNFRSRHEVLSGTNYIFKQIMGTNVGEIEYDEQAELKKGSGYPDEESFPIEMAIIDRDSELETDNELIDELEHTRLEARYMSKQIKQLIQNKQEILNVKTGERQAIRYKDIVILVRSMSATADYMEEFKQQGIPAYANLSTGYFDATEVAIMMSVLKVIDNPDQDIPLVSMLRSPIVGMTEEQLARIRTDIQVEDSDENPEVTDSTKHLTFFTSLQLYRKQEESEFYDKIILFFDWLNKWRNMAREGQLAELIWEIYRDTGYYEFVGGLPSGKQRQANLRALYDRARQYEQTSFRGLFRFLHFIERMRDRGKDLGVARALGEQEDVVRIMTIHSSKGLEFPVVFTAGIGRQFNEMDVRKSYLFDKELGFASMFVDANKQVKRPTLPLIALKRKKKLELLAEEMRVLYVAMTRAKEKLYLVGSEKGIGKKIEQWQSSLSRDEWLLSNFDRAAANSYLDWIGRSVIRHQDCSGTFQTNVRENEFSTHPSKWKIEIVDKNSLIEEEIEVIDDLTDWQDDVLAGNKVDRTSIFKDELIERLQWSYPYQMATRKLTKQSVSEIKRMLQEQDELSGTETVDEQQKKRTIQRNIYARPTFMIEETEVTAAERGTAMHAVMQHIPLDEKPTHDSVEELLQTLLEKELMTAEQIDVINIGQIVQFFETEFGQMMLTHSQVLREVPFTLGIQAKDIYTDWDGTEEKVIIQGIVDCILVDESGITLLDYKTDAITGTREQMEEKMKERYTVQIKYYCEALEKILKKPVKQAYLYLFSGDCFIKMDTHPTMKM